MNLRLKKTSWEYRRINATFEGGLGSEGATVPHMYGHKVFHKSLTMHSIRTLDEITCPYKMTKIMKCAVQVASKIIISTSNFMTKAKQTDKMVIPYAYVFPH